MPALHPQKTRLSGAAASRRKAELVLRIQAEREMRRALWLERRLAREAQGARDESSATKVFPRSRTLRALLGQPWLAVVAVGAGWLLGPRRLAAAARWLIPWLLKRGRS